ncbi:MAG: rhamnulokinase [Propioniciclava sp.]
MNVTHRPVTLAAADLGATSGRVIAGTLTENRFVLTELARFPNGPVGRDASIHTDARALWGYVRDGINAGIRQFGSLAGVGVDTWGVDYGKLTATGSLVDLPVHYRDDRTQGVPEELFSTLPARDLYQAAGLQVMPFNTIFQLMADARDGGFEETDAILLTPDLFNFWLSGQRAAEVTIASTTGLLDVAARQWSEPTCAHLAAHHGVPVPRILPELVEPGTILGESASGVLEGAVPVITVGSHDTASAVVSVPAETSRFAFISSGTWSLVGLELDRPVLTEASQTMDFTNELGVDGTVRYLKNVMGLWVLSEAIRIWREAGRHLDLDRLLAEAARATPLVCVVDIDDERLFPPGDMPARLQQLAAETGQHLEGDPVAVTRCILDSLALAYRRTIRAACELAGRDVDVVHIVGGGCQNTLLCQLTANATGLPVVAGPAEGTALGSLLIQARAVGALAGDLRALRQVVSNSAEVVAYVPGAEGPEAPAWLAAEQRIRP